jgi:hypothetical protein
MKFKYILIAILALCVSSAAAADTWYERYPTRSSISVGYKLNTGKQRYGGFTGSNPTATFRLTQRVTRRVSIEYVHISHWLEGRPFTGPGHEDQIDQFNITYDMPIIWWRR